MPFSLTPPWRSVWLPRVAVVAALIAGLPLFLRMPVWCDITLYDIAARNLLQGGMHYRDVFDTNLPGFVWILTGLRWLFGPGALVVRMADLLVVVGVVAFIDRLAKWGGATPASRWWAIAGVAFLYPFALEMVHVQRDTWMAFPALAAVVLRVWRMRMGTNPPTPFAEHDRGPVHTPVGFWSAFRLSAIEGALWGVAVWIKPHIILMAAGVWVLSAWRLAGLNPRFWRTLAADFLGNFAGGLTIGLAGIAWLVGTGTWPHFWNIVTVWNPEYAKLARREFHLRVKQELHWFPAWSFWIIPTVPLAILSVIDATPWRRFGDSVRPGPIGRILPGWLWERQAGHEARMTRGILAGLFLVWALQGFFIQRGFVYVHLPETLLMLGLWAAHRWALAVLILLWVALTSSIWLVADASPAFRERLLMVATDRHIAADPGEERYFVRHPLADPNRMRNWPDCWRFGLTEKEQYRRWDRLQRMSDHEAVIGWEEMSEVADYLRQRGVKDGEVVAWHDSPHVVYLMLGIKPGVRFMHVYTAESINAQGYAQVLSELDAASGTARFAVSDLEWTMLGHLPDKRPLLLGPPRDPPRDWLPADHQADHRASFPFNQPAVFRTKGGQGRYLVHELIPPLGDRPPP